MSAEMWDRLFEKFEPLNTRLESVTKLGEASYMIAVWGLWLSFATLAVEHPKSARKAKDTLVSSLKGRIDPGVLHAIEDSLISICDLVEGC